MPQLRFLFASKPDVMSKALGIVYRTIATHLIHTAGHTHDTAHAGAITFIQRFGSALNLNVHLMCMDAQERPWPDWRAAPAACWGRE